jgi:hypothetical protein
MLRIKNEKALRAHGLAIDPDDPNKAVPLTRLAKLQPSEKAQAAPFDPDELADAVAQIQQQAIESDCFTTVLYCRSGLKLLRLKSVFRELGRRDFCDHTENHGIKPWFRKRAMLIARHYGTEEACKGITLLDALHMARKKQEEVPSATASDVVKQPAAVNPNGKLPAGRARVRQAAKPATARETITETDDNNGDDQDQEKMEWLWEYVCEAITHADIADAEEVARDTFVAAVGGDDRAAQLVLQRIYQKI